jgi:crossover junction endodeoxyribonuclease RuvC
MQLTAHSERIVLGVDPGSRVTGWGVLRQTQQGIAVVGHGALHIGSEADTHPARLGRAFEELTKLITTYLPDEMAIEAPFFGRNVQSMLKLGRVQGVVMAAAMARSVPIVEYAPQKVKKAITGRGRATKEQVAALLPTHLPELRTGAGFATPDASDAVAIALCHLFQAWVGSAAAGSPKGGWAAFVKQHPDRIKP